MGYTPWGCIDLVSASTGEMAKDMDLSTSINLMMEPGPLKRKERFLRLV